MQIKIYLLIILSFSFLSITGKAQELFPKKELYHVWILAEEKLDAGKFDDALRLYNTHRENPNFAMKIRQISRLKEISTEAEKLRKRGNYAEAVDKYKEYRKLKDVNSLAVFEKKIDDCLAQINKGNLTELTAQQRVITGFEWAHRGREKLSLLDTIGAKRDFNNARILGGNRNTVLKEQYQEGNRVTQALSKWGQRKLEFELSNHSKADEAAFLSSYRDIRNIDIPDIELKIKTLKAEADGNGSLTGMAKSCDIDLLIGYVETNKTRVPASTELLNRLREFRSTKRKIDLLKQNKENLATVKSAYETLLNWADELPEEIKRDVKSCIDAEYKTIGNAEIKTSSRSCSGLAEFKKGVSLIRVELSNCNSSKAQLLWKETINFLNECENAKDHLKSVKSLRDSVFSMTKNDSLFSVYRAQIQKVKEKGDCVETIKIYNQMKLLRVCDQDVLDEEVETGLADITQNCSTNSWFKIEFTAGVARVSPKYSVLNDPKKMAGGWANSVGLQLSFIDHKNPVDFSIGIDYLNASYYSLDVFDSRQEDFSLSGANILLGLKLHRPNTKPGKIRPYIKIGSEILIPFSYSYQNYSSFTKFDGTSEIQKTILSLTGAIGLEIQKKHFGAFIESFGGYGLGNVYNSKVEHLTNSPNQKVSGQLSKFGLKVGIRFW
jgi:hypothetical protein